jgi:preprotein translocase subunit SecB
MNTPLQLKNFFIDRIVYEAYPEPEEGQNKLTLDHEIHYEEGQKEALVSITVKINTDEDSAGKRAYSAEFHVVGAFEFAEGLTEDQKQKHLAPLAITNLYGIARGVFAQLTGIGPFGKMIVPNVNVMAKLEKEKKEKEEKEKSENI